MHLFGIKWKIALISSSINKLKLKQILIIYFFGIGILALPAQGTKGITPVPAKANTSIGNTWAVIVGISDYQNPDIPDLQYAARDASAFIHYLKSPAGGSIEDSHIKGLLNEKATAGQFAAALDWLMEKAKENDQAIIYFSGHGDVERKTITQPGFLLCWDAPAKVYMGGGTFGLVYLQEVISTLSLQIKAKVIVITDACRSGKLAGSEIGGSHATAANLAKQYANEIKIMSCQPDELSIEGPEWGGGRGVFSYFLLNGITGLADQNRDGKVTLFELERFLDDKVPEAAAPKSQIPLTIGNKGAMISYVDQASLALLLKDMNSDLYTDEIVASTDKQIKSEEHQKTDPILEEKYKRFKKALKEGHLLFPEENAAWTLYQELKDKPFLKAELPEIQSNFAAALQDEAQQAINDYLKADPIELKKRWSYDERYTQFPAYLNKAAELLGESHFLYKSIKAREHYFSGLNLRLKGELKKDTTFYRIAISEQTKTLNLDSSAAYAYNELGILERRFRNYPKAISYFNEAIKHSPKWVYPWANLSISFTNSGNLEMGIKTGLKAVEIEPSSILSQLNLGVAYENNMEFLKAKQQYLKTLELDSTDKDALLDLARVLCIEKNYSKSEKVLSQYKSYYPEDVAMYLPAQLCLFILQNQDDKAYDALESSLKSGFNNFNSIESEPDLKNFITNPKYLALKKKYFN